MKLAAWVLALATAAAPARAAEQIGSWVLDCAGGKAACLMRSDKRFVEKAGVTGDLEIQAKGRLLIPVLTLRGLPTEFLAAAAAMAANAEASIQFPGAAREELQCNASLSAYICAPDGPAATRLAAALPSARSVTVQASVTLPGMKPLPHQEKSLDLSRTKEALARLRAAGPTPIPATIAAVTPRSPEGLMTAADKMLKAAGYSNGIAALQAMLAKYMGNKPAAAP